MTTPDIDEELKRAMKDNGKFDKTDKIYNTFIKENNTLRSRIVLEYGYEIDFSAVDTIVDASDLILGEWKAMGITKATVP